MMLNKDENKYEGLQIDTYVQLENHLRNCNRWDSVDVGQFDVVGVVGLFSAIIDNLKTNLYQHEFETAKEMLSKENLRFLKELIM